MIPEYIKTALNALEREGFESFVVGGAVRDILRDVPVNDYDVTTSALPEQTARILTEAGYKLIIDSSAKFGTVVFLSPDDPHGKVEVTTFRSDDDYEDGRHPNEVTFGASLEEDASRRDFTINALYMDKNGNVIDPVNGKEDLEGGLIRAVGDPERRFREDALRILRAVRFEAKTGFKIETKTKEAMVSCADLLDNISAERICSECTGIVTAPYGPMAIRDNLEVMSAVIPELLIQKDFDQRSRFHDRDLLTHTLDTLGGIAVNENGVKDTSLAWSALLHDIGKPEVFTVDENGEGHMKGHAEVGRRIAERIADELKFPTELKVEITKLVTYHDSFPEPERKSVRRFVSKLGPDFCEKLFALQLADVIAHSPLGMPRLQRLESIVQIYHELIEQGDCLTVKGLAVSGSDLISSGFAEGPLIGKILTELLDRVMDETLENTYEALISYAKEHFEVI